MPHAVAPSCRRAVAPSRRRALLFRAVDLFRAIAPRESLFIPRRSRITSSRCSARGKFLADIYKHAAILSSASSAVCDVQRDPFRCVRPYFAISVLLWLLTRYLNSN
jgi:hypothetical protein